jgi:hypothetical protein
MNAIRSVKGESAMPTTFGALAKANDRGLRVASRQHTAALLTGASSLVERGAGGAATLTETGYRFADADLACDEGSARGGAHAVQLAGRLPSYKKRLRSGLESLGRRRFVALALVRAPQDGVATARAWETPKEGRDLSPLVPPSDIGVLFAPIMGTRRLAQRSGALLDGSGGPPSGAAIEQICRTVVARSTSFSSLGHSEGAVLSRSVVEASERSARTADRSRGAAAALELVNPRPRSIADCRIVQRRRRTRGSIGRCSRQVSVHR